MRQRLEKHREILLYILCGAGTFAVDWGLYALLVEWTGIRLANAIGWCGAVAFAFLTNKYFVFRKGGEGAGAFWRELLEFLGVRLASLVLQVAGVDLLVRWGLDWPLIGITGGWAKAVVTVVVILVNYVMSKFLVFRRGKEEGHGPG